MNMYMEYNMQFVFNHLNIMYNIKMIIYNLLYN